MDEQDRQDYQASPPVKGDLGGWRSTIFSASWVKMIVGAHDYLPIIC